jgi:formylglycine-generating enzyme required for sulfatase activity
MAEEAMQPAEGVADEPQAVVAAVVAGNEAKLVAEPLAEEPPAAPPLLVEPVEAVADEPAAPRRAATPVFAVADADVLAALFSKVAAARLPTAPAPPVTSPATAAPARDRFYRLFVPRAEGPAEGLAVQFAWIPPGEFRMGDGQIEEEKPVRKVTISKGFYMGVYQVTQSQWKAVMNYSGSRFRGDNLPVEMVSWTECEGFCERMRELTGKSVRLPTEAEWEYACRAGTTTAFYTGDGEAAMRQAGRYQGNSDWHTHPVGKLAANAWGLHDLHGNVWEWCQDWYGPYPAADQTDPRGSDAGEGRVVRGGSWRDPAEGCRASSRGSVDPTSRFFEIGFRVCFSPEG